MEEEEDEEEVVKRKSIKQVSNKSEYAISHEHTPFSPTTYTRSIGSSYGPSVTTLCHEIERPISTTGSTHGASCGNYDSMQSGTYSFIHALTDEFLSESTCLVKFEN